MELLSLFAGIGAFEKALDNMNIPYELVGFSEIDKYAVKSYCAIHNVDESKNLGDITKIDEKALPKNIDLITYGFPCQDISLAGKQKGLFNEDGTQTRSGLFFEALRIIEETRPKVAIAENVKNLTSKKFAEQFKIVLDSLEEAGYNNYWKVLNAKDYGIPQNRERVFIVSIRKDIDTDMFRFPEGFPLELRLKDMLENETDEKYYLSEKMFNYAFNMIKEAKGIGFSDSVDGSYINPTIANTIGCRSAAGQRSGTSNYVSDDFDEPLQVKDMKGSILIREATKKGYAEATEGDSVNLEHPNSKTRRGRVGHGVAQTLTTSPQQGVVINDNVVFGIDKSKNNPKVIDVANCITGREDRGVSNRQGEGTAIVQNLRVRKLTPKECFRLMGFENSDFEKAEAVNSNTQLYKQAGNSIVVPVVEHIINSLIDCGALPKEETTENVQEAFVMPSVDEEFEKAVYGTTDPIDEEKAWMYFSICLSETDYASLCEFMNNRNIEHKQI